jgi:ribonuclease D
VGAGAAARGVDPALVCSRNDLARLLQAGPAAKPEDHALLRGWRAELAGDLGVRPQQGIFNL